MSKLGNLRALRARGLLYVHPFFDFSKISNEEQPFFKECIEEVEIWAANW